MNAWEILHNFQMKQGKRHFRVLISINFGSSQEKGDGNQGGSPQFSMQSSYGVIIIFTYHCHLIILLYCIYWCTLLEHWCLMENDFNRA